MVDVSVTPANVNPQSDAVLEQGIAGETIAAGKTVYYLASSGKYMLAINSDATKDNAVIAVNSASLDQPITVQLGGEIDIGGTVVLGTTYCLSGTSGGIAPDADVIAADYKTVLGVAVSATNIKMARNTSGALIA